MPKTEAPHDASADALILVYDVDLKAPACVLLQAAWGCGARPAALRHFESRHWLTSPTPGMRKIKGTEAEWMMAAEITKRHWGAKRASAV